MGELSEILKNNTTQDITWLCSLSESELDCLISLKKLVIQRAKISGYQELAQNFDLKMLRALVFVQMEYARKKVQDDTSLSQSELELLDNCNFLNTHVDDTSIDAEELLSGICNKNSKKRKRSD